MPWHLPYNRGKSTEKPQSCKVISFPYVTLYVLCLSPFHCVCYRLSVVIVLCCYLCCSVIIVLFYVLIVCKIEKNEMGGACGAYGGWERCAQVSDW